MNQIEELLARKGLNKNFKLMVIEVTKQIEDTLQILNKPNPKLVEKIIARDDYIDNLKRVIENKCYSTSFTGKPSKKGVDIIRAANIIGANLERMADLAANIVTQTGYLEDHEFIHRFKFREFFKEVLQGLALLDRAFSLADISLALKICRAEFNLDNLFNTNLRRIIDELRTGEETENLVTTLFILRYLERMGDSLLNIGEAILFAATGEKLKIHQFQELENFLQAYNGRGIGAHLTIESFGETNSGCRIRHIREKDGGGSGSNLDVIFKEGRLEKLKKEEANIKFWDAFKPGLPPKIFQFQKNGKIGSLLLECLHGMNFQQMIVEHKTSALKPALAELKKTLAEIWTQSRKAKPASSGFAQQLLNRLDDIYKAHPGFKDPGKQIGHYKTRAFGDLLLAAKSLEKDIRAPFSVLTHGDFNLDNIIYEPETKKIRFIDLNRSCHQDYVQDLSVFMVSSFRVPVFATAIRQRLSYVAKEMYLFGRDFARKSGDTTYDARMALGVSRSFMTSTRFEFNDEFAETMRLRAIYLLEKLCDNNGKPWANFKLPEDALFY